MRTPRLALPLLALAGSAVAQVPEVLPAVTVTATRTEASPFDVPASVDVIDGARIRGNGRPEVSLSESLVAVPGVAARDRQNQAQDMQLSIRGFGARSTFGVRGVRIYVDGIPATMPDGQGQLSHIDLATAGRIEVLRGPFSALYGNSSGGVLQVFTEPGAGTPTLSMGVAAGSDGLLRPGLQVRGSTPALGYVLGVTHYSTDGWRDHSGADRGLANARLDIHAEPGDWTLVANSVKLRADDPLGLTRAQFEADPRSADAAATLFDTRKTVRQTQLGAIHERRLSGNDAVRLMIYAGQRDTTQYQAIPVAPQASPLHPGGVIGLERRYTGLDARWTRKGELAGSPLEIVAGLGYDRMQEHRQGWQNFSGAALGVQGALRRDEDNFVSNLDPYLQAQWRITPSWTATAGVRRSDVRFESTDRYISGANGNDSGNVRYADTLPVAALMYAVSPATHLYAALGRGFETPTFNELAYRPSGGTGLNFALKPSRSDNIEFGAKGRGSGEAWHAEWNAALFQTRTRDEIVTQTNSGGRSTFQNAGATRRRGVELSLSASVARDWQLQLAQTWLDARYSEAFGTCTVTPCTAPNLLVAAGNRIPGTANSVTAADLAWQPVLGWRGGMELRRSGRVFVNDANTDAAPAFTTVALHAGYAFNLKHWQLSASARVDNLVGRHYAGSVIVNEGNARFFEPAPDRTFTFKLAGSYAF